MKTIRPRNMAPGSVPPVAFPPAVINASEVYPLDEAARRLRWRKHSIRQALRNGLVAPKFGSRRYVTGQAVLDFLEKLAQEQADNQNP